MREGQSFQDVVEDGQTGYLIYPNTDDESVRFESVELTMADVREFLEIRNEIIETGEAYAPPSTYNRNCEGCSFAVEEWINGPEDALPPACTYHCQNERRWPCYETDGGELTTDCSLFDRCDQRTEYRDTDVIDYYESVREAFRKERKTRQTAKQVVGSLDETLLAEAGYRIPNMEFSGISGAGSILHFETDTPVVPNFKPGEVVRLRAQTESQADKAVYYGEDDGEYRFAPLASDVDYESYLTLAEPVDALYLFSTESVEEDYLPYLDFSQRRNEGDPLDTANETTDHEIPDTISLSEIVEYLDRSELFVDLPVGTTRNQDIAAIVRELVSTSYPHPDKDSVIPAEQCRALVLAATPSQVETAVSAQPDGDHFRLDGTSGPNCIENSDGYHAIQSRLLDSRSIVSSVQQATSDSWPGGLREFFHQLQEGSLLREITPRTSSTCWFYSVRNS
ncbi:hypothetical protein ACFQL1_16255 [Halomicroarcula sp. GCM10025709]|uniref:hypothetical protein n=1 Tax=Halomicroarcula sp. GCM10025709 TaxID=3252669 RepID=UPI00360840E6